MRKTPCALFGEASDEEVSDQKAKDRITNELEGLVVTNGGVFVRKRAMRQRPFKKEEIAERVPQPVVESVQLKRKRH